MKYDEKYASERGANPPGVLCAVLPWIPMNDLIWRQAIIMNTMSTMNKLITRMLPILTAVAIAFPAVSVRAFDTLPEDAIDVPVPSAILMEKSTGTVVFEKNAHERLSPASVTKVMTMLLIMEELERGTLSEDDMVTSSTRASSMGGSQIFLKEGERMSVRDMLKSVAVGSANDCSVALAEHIAGTEEAFVARMNARASELGMKDTEFSNCTGLFEGEHHLTTAFDIALMSRELIRHERIKEYTTIWMDRVRDGLFGLNNTNRLIYYYEGSTGLKTGFTSRAGYCLAATAMRDGVEYIAVVMHGSSSDARFESAKTLLNYAFANLGLFRITPPEALPPIPVELGWQKTVQPVYEGPQNMLFARSELPNVRISVELEASLKAPVTEGQQIGTVKVYSGETLLEDIPIVSDADVALMGIFDIFLEFLRML